MAELKKINLAEKLSSFEDAFGPRIIGRYNGDKIQVTKVKGSSSGTRTRTRTT